MKKLSEIYNELGIAFSFPIQIKNSNGNETYYENSNGFWNKRERDAKGNETYYEDSNVFWCKYEYDANGNETYYEDSEGVWRTKYAGTFGGTSNTAKYEYDAKGNDTYCETCEGKVVEIDGNKYELKAL